MAVYLIHFNTPLSHARHYVGYTTNLARRIAEHRRGQSSPLMRAVNAAGIPWRVGIVWTRGGRELERAIKASHHTARYCPICNPYLALEYSELPRYALEQMKWVLPCAGDATLQVSNLCKIVSKPV